MVSNYSVEYGNKVLLPLTHQTTLPPMGKNMTYRDYPEGMVALAMNKYYLWVLCCLGLVFNTAAILTISKLKPFTTSSLYVILLAIFDTLTLFVKLAYLQLTYHDVRLGDAGCKILCFIGSFLDQFSVWILVLLTIERFVAVWLPLKVSSWFTMFRARLAVAITALALIFINSHMLLLLHQVELEEPYGVECDFYPSHAYFGKSIWYWTESCLTAIFPCIILIVLNSLIVYRMRRSMEKQKKMLSGTESPRMVSHKTHLTVMLVTVSVSFVVLMLPLAMFNTFRSKWKVHSDRERAQYILTRELTHFLADCNHGLNFLFYFLSSKRFRHIFYRIVQCRCQEPRRTFYSGASKMSYYKCNQSSMNTYCMQSNL
ncbi:probable G-protein coupled receptor 139 [Liolophura sinensis]|uniref:probable G-protein coupled receptor 139 n=1 Tax=Liolophura sinensis TaxID=3198878 RepID=UPI00315913BF